MAAVWEGREGTPGLGHARQLTPSAIEISIVAGGVHARRDGMTGTAAGACCVYLPEAQPVTENTQRWRLRHIVCVWGIVVQSARDLVLMITERR